MQASLRQNAQVSSPRYSASTDAPNPMSNSTLFSIISLFAFIVAGCGPPPEALQEGESMSPDSVQVLHMKDSHQPEQDYEAFHFLADEIDIDSSQYIGCLQASEQEDVATIDELMNALRGKAFEMGANAFQVDRVISSPDTNLVSVQLDIFEVSESVVKRNEKHFTNNMVYVFGDLDSDDDSTSFELNEQSVAVAPLRYIAHQNEVGGETTTSIGGFLTGAKLTLQGEEGRPPTYWSLSEFGIGPYSGVRPGPPGGFGVSINTGRVHPVNPNLGRFLVHVLEEQEAL